MNVLCSFLTIYALLCSNVAVHLSDHNRVIVAQVDYHRQHHHTILHNFQIHSCDIRLVSFPEMSIHIGMVGNSVD